MLLNADMGVKNKNSVEKEITSCPLDYCNNMAAYKTVDRAEDKTDLVYAVNCDGVANPAIACNEKAVPLIHGLVSRKKYSKKQILLVG